MKYTRVVPGRVYTVESRVVPQTTLLYISLFTTTGIGPISTVHVSELLSRTEGTLPITGTVFTGTGFWHRILVSTFCFVVKINFTLLVHVVHMYMYGMTEGYDYYRTYYTYRYTCKVILLPSLEVSGGGLCRVLVL